MQPTKHAPPNAKLLKYEIDKWIATPKLSHQWHNHLLNLGFFFFICNKRLALETPKSSETDTHEEYKQRPKKLGSKDTKKGLPLTLQATNL